MHELTLGHPSPKYVREDEKYKEGHRAFAAGESITENPYTGEVDPSAWYWAFGWYDAMADVVRVLNTKAITGKFSNERRDNGKS